MVKSRNTKRSRGDWLVRYHSQQFLETRTWPASLVLYSLQKPSDCSFLDSSLFPVELVYAYSLGDGVMNIMLNSQKV